MLKEFFKHAFIPFSSVEKLKNDEYIFASSKNIAFFTCLKKLKNMDLEATKFLKINNYNFLNLKKRKTTNLIFFC